MEFSRPEYWSEWVVVLFSRQGIFPTQGSNPGHPHCGRILDQLSHQGGPRITGVGSLSFLQRIFPTQESNWGLLDCRWILYQLSYQGSPIYLISSLQSLNVSIYVKWLEQNLASTKYYVSICYQLLYEILCPRDLVKSLLY